MGVLWQIDDADREVLTEGAVVDGLLVGVRTARDGAQSVVALDPRTAADRWTTPLSERGSRAGAARGAGLDHVVRARSRPRAARRAARP